MMSLRIESPPSLRHLRAEMTVAGTEIGGSHAQCQQRNAADPNHQDRERAGIVIEPTSCTHDALTLSCPLVSPGGGWFDGCETMIGLFSLRATLFFAFRRAATRDRLCRTKLRCPGRHNSRRGVAANVPFCGKIGWPKRSVLQ